ncbi:MAG: ABC transporter permease [Thermoplasmata archaeon]|nr:ABC transporter permease [Thermoplasmata archaeon]
MKISRVIAIARKNFRSLRHDRRTAAFIFVVPLMMMLIFGYTFGGDVKNISVVIVNLDEGFMNESFSWSIISELNDSETFKIVDIYTSEDISIDPVNKSIERVRNAEIWAAIIFEENFTSDAIMNIGSLRQGQPFVPSGFTLYLDRTNPNVGAAVTGELTKDLQLLLILKYHLTPPVILETEMIYGEDTKFIDFFAPGIMGLAGLLVTFMLTIVTFVRERSSFTLERLLTTPVTEGEIVAGYALSFGILALAQSTVILLTGILLFNIQIVGSVLLALLIIYLLGVGSMGMGLMLSSIAKNELQAVQFVPIVFIPSILLAGIFWPLEAIPELLRPVSYFIPLTYAVDGCRSVMVRGWGIEEVWIQVTVLILFALVMLLLSTYMLKRRK